MIKTFIKSLVVCSLSIPFFTSCGEDRSGEYYALIGTQTWIYQTMQHDYLFYQDLPKEEGLNFFTKPREFVESLVSSNDQKNGAKFTHLDSIYNQQKPTRTSKFPSFGFEGAIVRVPNGSEAIRIIYTEKESPATEASLKRGDWIIAANGKKINSNSYATFINRPTGPCRFTLGSFNGEGFDTLKVVDMPAPRPINVNNLLETHLITSGNKKAFYILYNEFGDDEKQLKSLFAQMANMQFDDIILDLRYNPGGYVATSQVLASNLAPQSALNKPFLQMTSNDIINKKDVYNLDPSMLGTPAPISYGNLYIITSGSTASASEIIINGLKPYMKGKLFQVGTATFGKNVAQTRYWNETTPDVELWLTTHKLSNSEDFSDYFTNGLPPDYEIAENLGGDLGALGGKEDILMKPVLEHMATGNFPANKEEEETTPSRSRRVEIVHNPISKKPKLLLLGAPAK